MYCRLKKKLTQEGRKTHPKLTPLNYASVLRFKNKS